MLNAARGPAGEISTAADPHYGARAGSVRIAGRHAMKLPGRVSHRFRTPGAMGWLGPRLGVHTDEVLEALGHVAPARARLREQGVI